MKKVSVGNKVYIKSKLEDIDYRKKIKPSSVNKKVKESSDGYTLVLNFVPFATSIVLLFLLLNGNVADFKMTVIFLLLANVLQIVDLKKED